MKTIAQIFVTDFTGALDDVEGAVVGGMSETVVQALAIAGLILAGLKLWAIFKELVRDAGPKSDGREQTPFERGEAIEIEDTNGRTLSLNQGGGGEYQRSRAQTEAWMKENNVKPLELRPSKFKGSDMDSDNPW